MELQWWGSGNFTDVALSTAAHWKADTSRAIVSEWHGGDIGTSHQHSQEKSSTPVRPESQNVMTVHVQMKTSNSCYSKFGDHMIHDIQQHGVACIHRVILQWGY